MTSPLFSHRLDSIQILNSLNHALCLPPFSVFFLFLINVFNNNLWHCLSELSDLSLRSLASRLESSVVASRAPGTTEAYRRAFLWWKEFASSKTEICAFPANLEHVALYLQHLLNTTYSHSAVDFAIWNTLSTPFGGFTFHYRQLDYPCS